MPLVQTSSVSVNGAEENLTLWTATAGDPRYVKLSLVPPLIKAALLAKSASVVTLVEIQSYRPSRSPITVGQ